MEFYPLSLLKWTVQPTFRLIWKSRALSTLSTNLSTLGNIFNSKKKERRARITCEKHGKKFFSCKNWFCLETRTKNCQTKYFRRFFFFTFITFTAYRLWRRMAHLFTWKVHFFMDELSPIVSTWIYVSSYFSKHLKMLKFSFRTLKVSFGSDNWNCETPHVPPLLSYFTYQYL